MTPRGRGGGGELWGYASNRTQTNNPYFPFHKQDADVQMLKHYLQQLQFSWLRVATLSATVLRRQVVNLVTDGGSCNQKEQTTNFSQLLPKSKRNKNHMGAPMDASLEVKDFS